VLPVGLAVTTTEDEEDIDGGPWPLFRVPYSILCISLHLLLQMTSQIAVIAPVVFQSCVLGPAMTNTLYLYCEVWVMQHNAIWGVMRSLVRGSLRLAP
jgi:hypothetical protein